MTHQSELSSVDAEAPQPSRWRRSPVEIGAGIARIADREKAAVRSALIRSRIAGVGSSLLHKQILHCFGDSHAKVFGDIRHLRLLPATWFDVTIISGATALGLANPRSQTQALPRFERVIRRVPRDRQLLFMLGEVDCGFVIWYRAQTQGFSPMAELERSVGNYIRFLERLLVAGRSKLVIAAAPPPTILDYQDWGEVAQLRRAVRASLKDRTDLTKLYNARLRDWAEANECAFLDYLPEVMDPVEGILRDRYRNPDPLDHHLAPEPFASLLAEHLHGIGFQ